jgi:amidohydrolase
MTMTEPIDLHGPPEDLPGIRELEQAVLAALDAELASAVAVRHTLHREPRLGGDEAILRPILAEALGAPLTPAAEGGYLRIGPDGRPAVAIRAELDALPNQERSDVPFRSIRSGEAHLCGHDVHTAALIAAARAIREVGPPLPLVALFQPREEVMPSGAEELINHQGLLGEGIRAMLGVHLQPTIPAGSVSAVAGAINASADNVAITIHGRPAHGAYPHLSRDPIVAASAVVQGLQHLVSRRVDPMHPAVVTIGRISGGESNNQIAAEVRLDGTIRSFTEEDRAELHRAVTSVAAGIAEGYGCTADVDIVLGEPVLRNDDDLALYVSRALEAEGLLEAPAVRSCGADDFAFYVSRFPSLMIFAGVGDAAPGTPGLHHPAFVPPDDTIAAVARIMVVAYFAAVRELLIEERRTT